MYIGGFPFAPWDRSDQYFSSENDGFKKENYWEIVGSDLEKTILIFYLNTEARSGQNFVTFFG